MNGDCLGTLKTLPDNFVDCVVTSPPYWGLRDYGTAKWEGGKKDCDHLGPVKTTQAGFNERYTGKPSLKEDKQSKLRLPYKDVCGKCGAKRVDNQLGLEKNFEEYVSKLCDIFDEVKRVLKPTGTCWVNLGDTYSTVSGNMGIGTQPKYVCAVEDMPVKLKTELPDKCLCLIPQRFQIEMVNRGWTCRNTIIWQKPNCMPTSVNDRFTVDFEYVFFFVKNKKYYFEQQLEKSIWADSDKRSKVKGGVLSGGKKTSTGLYAINKVAYTEGGLRNKRTVWSVNTQPFKEAHFATYPPSLIEPMIKSGCPEQICVKCSIPQIKEIVSVGYIQPDEIDENCQDSETINDKPYAIKERTGFIAKRELPSLKEIKDYLNKWKKKKALTIEQIEGIMKSNAPHHWFSGESYPVKNDWLELKKIMGFDDTYDNAMTNETYKPAEKLAGQYELKKKGCDCKVEFKPGIVLDPFMGSGTTGMVAMNLNRNYLGIELNPEYIKIANKRIADSQRQGRLF